MKQPADVFVDSTVEAYGAMGIHSSEVRDVVEEFPEIISSKGICTAVALRMVGDITLKESIYYLTELTGKIPGEISWEEYLDAMKEVGYTLKEVDGWYNKSMKRFAESYPKGRFLVSTRSGNHAAAIVDGKIKDWTKERRTRIYRVWKMN